MRAKLMSIAVAPESLPGVGDTSSSHTSLRSASDRVDRFLERKLHGPSSLFRGTVYLVAVAVGYAVCIALLALGGAQPGTAPWLRISAASYFHWEAAFIGPVIFFGGVLAAGTMHLVATASGGDGSFDDTFAGLAISIAIATLATLVPDTVVGLLLVTGSLDPDAWMRAITSPSLVLGIVWLYLLTYLAAFLVLFPSVVRVCYKLPRRTAAAIGCAVFAVYQLFLYVFVR